MRISLGIVYTQSRVCLGLPILSPMAIWSTHRAKTQSQILFSTFSFARISPSLRDRITRHPARSKAIRGIVECGSGESEIPGNAGVHSIGMGCQQSIAARSEGDDGPNEDRRQASEMELKSCGKAQVIATHRTSKLSMGSDVSTSSLQNDKGVEDISNILESLCLIFLFVLDRLTSRRFGESKNQSALGKLELGLAQEDGSLGCMGIRRADEEAPSLGRRWRGKGKRKVAIVNSKGRERKYKIKDETASASLTSGEDEKYMMEALVEAKKAAVVGEVPVGAVIVQNSRIIARAYNRVESERDPTAHAEILCIRSAAKHHGDWRLMDATLYVTLEPCPMCAGAILQSRFRRLVWGSPNTLLGADGSWISLLPEMMEAGTDRPSPELDDKPSGVLCSHPFHSNLEVRRGILATDCSTVMRTFFQLRRNDRPLSSRTKPWWLPFSAWVLLKKLFRW